MEIINNSCLIVKCSHCGKEISLDKAVPCTWKDIEPGKDHTWYYCNECNKCYGNKK